MNSHSVPLHVLVRVTNGEKESTVAAMHRIGSEFHDNAQQARPYPASGESTPRGWPAVPDGGRARIRLIHMTATSPQRKPTLWEETLLLGAGPTGERSGPPPRLAVEGRSSGHGPMLPISDVDKVKPMLLPHGGWPMAAGPASRLGSIEPGEKTGLRLSPAPST